MSRMLAHSRRFGGAIRCAAGLFYALLVVASPTPSLGSETATPAGVPSSQIWRMPGDTKSARIEGEDGSISWPVYVPASSVSRLNRFQLVFQAAISVMPEASWLTVGINGRTLGRIPIASPTSAKVIEFDVPSGTLSPGWNEVRLSTVQRHRVDCSIDATYELWTQIDPVRTGFVGSPAVIGSLDDLAAVQPDASGVERIRLTLPPNPEQSDVERGLDLAERVALRAHFLHPVVDLSSAPASIEVSLIGTAIDAAAAAKTIAPGLQLVDRAAGLPTLIPAVGSRDFEKMFDRIDEEPTGTPEGLRALSSAFGFRIRPDRSVTLAELGVATHAFSGRLFRTGFDLVLPPDAYLSDYGEAKLSVDGGYAGDLLTDARLVIRVNGVIDGSLALDRLGGAVLKGQIIHMPLGAFRPGRNHIEIEAQLPTLADQTCDTLTAIDAKERFLILGTSTLTFPDLARISTFPNLSATFVNGFRTARNIPVNVYLPRPTVGAIGAAGTLLANVAIHTGAPIDATILQGQPRGSGAAVVVSVASDLPAGFLQSVGVDTASTDAWSAAKGESVAEAIAAAKPTQNRTDEQRLDTWGKDTLQTNSWLGSAVEWFERVSLRSLRSAGLIDYPDPPYSITSDTRFMISQAILADTKVTLIAAPDEPALIAGAIAITDTAQLGHIDGRLAALDSAGTGLDLAPTRHPIFVSTAPFTFSNERLIAAGWLSSHAGYYIAAVLFVSILLGALTWVSLKFSRAKG
jgi:cellulose synthase operon protein B